MSKRFVSIWFPYLETDWHLLRSPQERDQPFVVSAPSHGKMIIVAVNAIAHRQGITAGMSLADARAIFPGLQVTGHVPGLALKLLKKIAAWCIRFTPVVGIDGQSGILLDASGCAHLWGGEENYVREISRRFLEKGFGIRIAMADTIGTAWAITHYGENGMIAARGRSAEALMALPPEGLRLEAETISLLHKLGLQQIGRFLHMPASTLRRRFGQLLIKRLQQALGKEEENIIPLLPIPPCLERLNCLEPIKTAKGIEIALETLLNTVCRRLQSEQKGLRAARFICYRVDGGSQQLEIATSHPSHHVLHIQKLFSDKLASIEPKEGIELFVLEAPLLEDHAPAQETIWETAGHDRHRLSELIDRIAGRIGESGVQRFIPAEHYWPERSYQASKTLYEEIKTGWRKEKPRPVQLLDRPEPVEVTAPIPDYPPMLFRYKGKLHKVVKADGPERIEQEWWLQQGRHRDYYAVEDEEGQRYWLFRSGHYGNDQRWYVHGFFA